MTNRLLEGFVKPIAQIKKSKIRLLFVRKLVHSPAIDYVSRLPACHNYNKKNGAGRNQANFTSFFFTHQVLQSPLLIISIAIFIGGCATHPTVSTTRMETGEKKYGWSWSAENVFPYLWYRYGLSDKSDIGLRVGLPIYGTGIDYSRILYSKKNKWDVLNIAWSLNPNYNSDFTYYKFKQRTGKGDTPGAISWWGLRMMYIHKGITDGSSTRIGFLLGGQPNEKWGYELGYNHDFNSMPITKLFDFNWNNTVKNDKNLSKRYGDTPHVDPGSGLPTEYSRITGISFRIFVNLGLRSSEKTE